MDSFCGFSTFLPFLSSSSLCRVSLWTPLPEPPRFRWARGLLKTTWQPSLSLSLSFHLPARLVQNKRRNERNRHFTSLSVQEKVKEKKRKTQNCYKREERFSLCLHEFSTPGMEIRHKGDRDRSSNISMILGCCKHELTLNWTKPMQKKKWKGHFELGS